MMASMLMAFALGFHAGMAFPQIQIVKVPVVREKLVAQRVPVYIPEPYPPPVGGDSPLRPPPSPHCLTIKVIASERGAPAEVCN